MRSGPIRRAATAWRGFWLQYQRTPVLARAATRLATIGMPPYKGRIPLAQNSAAGYIAASARLHRLRDIKRGRHLFIDERVTIYQDWANAGPVELGDGVHLMQDTVIEVGSGGAVSIGARTHIQARGHLTSYEAPLHIGQDVEIAPDCAFFTYDHGFEPGQLISQQPLRSRSGITLGDDVWLGRGVTVLDGVTIGNGAVIGAGAVVKNDIRPNAIAAGVPARVIGSRGSANAEAQIETVLAAGPSNGHR